MKQVVIRKLLDMNKELIEIKTNIQTKKINPSIKFKYWINENLSILESKVKVIQESIDPGKKFKEFESKREAICNEFSEKYESGKPIIIKGSYKITLEQNFIKKINELKEEYFDTPDGQNIIETNIIEFFKEFIDIPNFYAINIKDIDEDILNMKQLQIFMELNMIKLT